MIKIDRVPFITAIYNLYNYQGGREEAQLSYFRNEELQLSHGKPLSQIDTAREGEPEKLGPGLSVSKARMPTFEEGWVRILCENETTALVKTAWVFPWVSTST